MLERINKWKYRINTPGKVSKNNWSVMLPLSLEKLIKSNIHDKIKAMLNETGRLLA
jgi:4-alpha-glucanotransferase